MRVPSKIQAAARWGTENASLGHGSSFQICNLDKVRQAVEATLMI